MSGGTLELAARELSSLLEPLADDLTVARISGFLALRGLRFPDAVLTQASVAGPLAAAQAAAAALGAKRAALESALAGTNELAAIQAGTVLLQALTSLFNLLDSLGNALGALPPGSVPGIDAPALADFSTNLTRRLIAHGAITYLSSRAQTFSGVLALAGVLDNIPIPEVPGNPAKPGHMLRDIHLARLPDFLQNPAGLLRTLYGWGNPSFDAQALLNRIAAFLGSLGISSRVESPAPGKFTLRSLFAEITVDTSVVPNGLSAQLHVGVDDRTTRTFTVAPNWATTVTVKGTFVPESQLKIAPPAVLTLVPPAAGFSGSLTSTLQRSGPRFVLLGSADGSRIEVAGCSVSAGIAFDARGLTSEGHLRVAVNITDGKAVIDTSKGDSFLAFLTGGVRGEANFSLSGSWTPEGGLSFEGSSGLEIALPVHASIGPAHLDTFYLRAGIEEGSIPVEISAAIGATLGPLEVTVDRLGIIARLSFPKSGGNLGPLNLAFEPKLPSGVGLEVNAGGFTGGGFLRLDPDKGEYEGGLELTFLGTISVRAIGVLSTRLPDGRKGFSLVIIIVAEFPPIQLSWGFTLVGVGGLLGLNRTVLLEELQSGVHDGSLNSILFPTDIVANSARIISDLKRVFPPRDGRFLVGPMAKLGWGTPTLISLSLGLILEIPRPMFAIIGVLHMALPAEDLPLLHLQVSFAGSVDFESGQLQFDASLFDSRMGTFTLTGDMAVRAYWKENANFLLTVGGFHPAYTPPPMNLPELARLGMVLFQGNPHVSAQVYFAVTSNSVQLGARVEVYYGIDLFNVYGFLGLDVLINFNPFHFVAEITAEIGVRTGDTVLFAIQLQLLLEGPTPWHARGTGSFRIGFIIKVTVSAGFDITFGDARETRLPPVDVLAEMVKALSNLGNWRPQLPAGSNQHVTLRELPDPTNTLVLQPFGALEITQKLVPLHVAIQRFGSRAPAAGSVFTLADAKLGAEDAGVSNYREQFAPAQFFNMSDAEKLSRPSFAYYDAGIVIGGDLAPRTDLMRTRDVVYEVIYLPEHHPVRVTFGLASDLAGYIVRGSAVAQSPVSHAQRSVSVLEETASLAPESYAVVSTNDLRLHAAHLVFDNATAADQAVQSLISEQPELFGAIQVLPAAAMAGRSV